MGRGVFLDTLQVSTLSFVTLTSFVANGLLLGASLFRRAKATPGDFLMAAMAVADMLVAVCIPINILADFEAFGNGDTYSCVLANSPTMSMPVTAMYMLIAMTVERCINIFLPLRAKELITRRRVAVVIAAVMSYGFFLTLLLPLCGHALPIREERGSNQTDCNFAAIGYGPFVAFMLLGNLCPGMIILLVLNTAIFFVARKHLHKITAALPAGQDSNSEIISYRKQKTRNNAVMYACQLYVLSYLPVTVALLMDFQFFTVDAVEEWIAPFILYALGAFLASFNTVFNPIILIKTNRQYREWVRVKVLRRKPKINSSDPTTACSGYDNHGQTCNPRCSHQGPFPDGDGSPCEQCGYDNHKAIGDNRTLSEDGMRGSTPLSVLTTSQGTHPKFDYSVPGLY